MNQSVDVVIVAAGMGTRLGLNIPKAFVDLNGRPLLEYSLETFGDFPKTGRIAVVVPYDRLESAREFLERRQFSVPVSLVPGGKYRWQSVRNGAGTCSTEWILVHDAARPFVTPGVIEDLLQKHKEYRCAVTAVPETDTIRRFRGDCCVETLDRSEIVRIGTPQLFHRESLMDALSRAELREVTPTDEAVLMEECGHSVGFAWGDPLNFKITTSSDLETAEAILARK